jgi:hypothetical protein
MPARQEPRVDAEPHGGPPVVTDPDRFRPQPSQLLEAGERALYDPGSARPVHSFRYTSRAVNGLGSRPCVSLAASSAAATRAWSVTLA